jgi:hypothetical protein
MPRPCLPGAHVDPKMRTYEGQHAANQQATIIRNVENGYAEWFGQVADPNERMRLARLLKTEYNITVPKELV